MNSYKLFSSALAITMLVIISCTRHQDSLSNKTHGLPSSERLNLLSQLSNPDDHEDENINQVLFMFANGLSSFVNENGIMSTIKNEVINLEYPDVPYDKLMTIDNRFQTLMNAFLVQHCPIDPKEPNHNCIEHLAESMRHHGVDYFINITVPNSNSADWSKKPIICIGASIDNNDNIPGLKIHNNGNITSTVMSEQHALNANEPVIIINNDTEIIDYSIDSGSFVTNQPPLMPSSGPSQYVWYQYQIKPGYRYETGFNNKSELQFIITMHNNNGSWLQGSGIGFPFGRYEAQIAEVWPNDINNGSIISIQANYPSLFEQVLTATNTQLYRYAYITTYERDWYASGKDVAWCLNNSSNFFVGTWHICKMKYNNEWYHNTLCTFDLTGFMPGVNYTAGYGGQKSFYTLKRTN
jgi:hypothetical protein